jgi:hypothetical protein
MAQVWPRQHVIFVNATVLEIEIGVGTSLFSVLPTPNWPTPFSPQQYTDCATRAHVYNVPHETSEAPAINFGVKERVVVLSPSCPSEFLPQQRMFWSDDMAQV